MYTKGKERGAFEPMAARVPRRERRVDGDIEANLPSMKSSTNRWFNPISTLVVEIIVRRGEASSGRFETRITTRPYGREALVNGFHGSADAAQLGNEKGGSREAGAVGASALVVLCRSDLVSFGFHARSGGFQSSDTDGGDAGRVLLGEKLVPVDS